MTTDTTTTTRTLELVDYSGREMPHGTYFAVRDGYGAGMWTLVVTEEDSRHHGMWKATPTATTSEERQAIPDDGKTYYGWRVDRSTVTVHETPALDLSDQDTTPETETDPALTTFGALPVGDLFANVGGESGSLWVKTDADRYQTFGNGHHSHAGLNSDYPVVRIPASDVLAAFRGASSDSGAFERGKEEGRREVQSRWDEWKEDATRVAHEYADANSLCSEFDRCMEAIGLPTRDEWNKEFTVTYTYSTTVTARDEDSAIESVSGDDYSLRHYGEWTAETDD